MRLSREERDAIVASIRSEDEGAVIYLHGSRTDDSLKGGDIDLIVFSDVINLERKLRILRRIFERIDEQKIDLFVTKDQDDPFVQLALQKGVEL